LDTACKQCTYNRYIYTIGIVNENRSEYFNSSKKRKIHDLLRMESRVQVNTSGQFFLSLERVSDSSNMTYPGSNSPDIDLTGCPTSTIKNFHFGP